MRRREGGKPEKPAGCPGQWGCDSGESPGSARSWVPAPTTLSPFQGSPRAGPGRKSLAVTPCLKHSLLKAFPWQTAPDMVTPFPAELPNCFFPSAPPASPVPPRPRCRTCHEKPLCLPGISSPSLISATPVNPSLPPLPPSPQPELGFPRRARGWLCLPAGFGRSAGAQHTLGASCGQGQRALGYV